MSDSAAPGGARLYVGNLAYATTEEGLRAFFAVAGSVVSVEIPRYHDTGKPLGFAFVTMATPFEASRAISMCHGRELDGRALAVTVARPEPAPDRRRKRRRG